MTSDFFDENSVKGEIVKNKNNEKIIIANILRNFWCLDSRCLYSVEIKV
jgi:hypothetical protein